MTGKNTSGILCIKLHKYKFLKYFKRGNDYEFKGKKFLTLKDYTEEEITYLLDLAAELKEKRKKAF